MTILTDNHLQRLAPQTTLRDDGFRADGIHCQLLVVSGQAKPNRPPLKSWRIYFTHEGKRTYKTIGHYPSMSLAEARERAATAALKIRTGSHPFKDTPKGGTTYLDALSRYAKHISADRGDGVPRLRSWRQRISNLRRFEESWGSRALQSITADDAADELDSIALTAPKMAYLLRGQLSKLWDFAIKKRLDRDLSNPFRDLEVGEPGGTREKHLKEDAIADLWGELEEIVDAGIRDPARSYRGLQAAAVELAILTGSRRYEVMHSRWSEVRRVEIGDLDTPALRRFFERRRIQGDLALGEWLVIPGYRFDEKGAYLSSTKGGRVRPAFLGSEIGRYWLDRCQALQNGATDWMFASPRLGRPPADFQGLFDSLNLAGVGWHVVRHSVGTLLQKLGYNKEEIGSLLGHRLPVASAVTSTYLHPELVTVLAKAAPIYSDLHSFYREIFPTRPS